MRTRLGSDGSGSGAMVHALAEKRCKDFGTCTQGREGEAKGVLDQGLRLARFTAGSFGGQLQIFSGLSVEALAQLDGGQLVEIACALLASLRLRFESRQGGFVAADPQDLAGDQDRGGAEQQQKPNQVGLWE